MKIADEYCSNQLTKNCCIPLNTLEDSLKTKKKLTLCLLWQINEVVADDWVSRVDREL